jgi:hypothetical protein
VQRGIDIWLVLPWDDSECECEVEVCSCPLVCMGYHHHSKSDQVHRLTFPSIPRIAEKSSPGLQGSVMRGRLGYQAPWSEGDAAEPLYNSAGATIESEGLTI